MTQWRSHLLKCDTVLCNLELRTFLAPTCLFFRLLHISLLTGFTSMAKVILAVTPCRMPASSLLKMSITEYSWSLLEEVRSTVLTTVGNVTFDVDMLLPGYTKPFESICYDPPGLHQSLERGVGIFARLHNRNTVVLLNLSMIRCSWWHHERSSQMGLIEWYHLENLYPFIWQTSYLEIVSPRSNA